MVEPRASRRSSVQAAPVRSVALAAIATAAVALLLGGCTQLEQVLRAPPEEVREPPGLMLYVETLHAHAAADERGRVQLAAALEEAYESGPTLTNRLRLALVLASPANDDAARARGAELLEALLADDDDALLESERLLARLRLAELARAEAATAARLAAVAPEDDDADHDAALADAVAAHERAEARSRELAAENAALAEALADAEAKLEAIATIERSMRERE